MSGRGINGDSPVGRQTGVPGFGAGFRISYGTQTSAGFGVLVSLTARGGKRKPQLGCPWPRRGERFPFRLGPRRACPLELSRTGQVAEWSKAADCKSAGPCGLRRFESSPVHQEIFDSRLAIYDCKLRCSVRRPVKWNYLDATQSAIINGQSTMGCGSNSVVESQPSKLLVAGSIPVSRSNSKFENGNSKLGDAIMQREFRFSNFEFRAPAARGPM